MDTSQTILQVAQQLFIKQGYTATSMREIAEGAGIGKATIYHHFRDKQTIALKLLDDVIQKMQSGLDVIQAEQDPCQRIEVAAKLTLGFLFDSAELLQIVRREVPGARETMKRELVIFFTRFSSLLEEAFIRGMEAGIFRPIDPSETARVFLTMIQGNFAMLILLGIRASDPEKAVASLLDVFINGIRAE